LAFVMSVIPCNEASNAYAFDVDHVIRLQTHMRLMPDDMTAMGTPAASQGEARHW